MGSFRSYRRYGLRARNQLTSHIKHTLQNGVEWSSFTSYGLHQCLPGVAAGVKTSCVGEEKRSAFANPGSFARVSNDVEPSSTTVAIDTNIRLSTSPEPKSTPLSLQSLNGLNFKSVDLRQRPLFLKCTQLQVLDLKLHSSHIKTYLLYYATSIRGSCQEDTGVCGKANSGDVSDRVRAHDERLLTLLAFVRIALPHSEDQYRDWELAAMVSAEGIYVERAQRTFRKGSPAEGHWWRRLGDSDGIGSERGRGLQRSRVEVIRRVSGRDK